MNSSLAPLRKYYPLFRDRHYLIKGLVGCNVALYAYYKQAPGANKMLYEADLTISAKAGWISLIFAPFCHVDFSSLVWNTGLLWTIGNYHVLNKGVCHFSLVFGAGLALGSLFTIIQLKSNRDAYMAGPQAGTAALLSYNAITNPAWFKVINPYFLLAALAYQSAINGAHYNAGGVFAGYLTFLFL
jgi:membrane associated rhomboid family serine protease